MNALTRRFLHAAELRALTAHEAQLAAAFTLTELPDLPIRRGEREPPEKPLMYQGGRTAESTRVAIRRAYRFEGLTIKQLEARFGCCERTIHRHLKGHR